MPLVAAVPTATELSVVAACCHQKVTHWRAFGHSTEPREGREKVQMFVPVVELHAEKRAQQKAVTATSASISSCRAPLVPSSAKVSQKRNAEYFPCYKYHMVVGPARSTAGSQPHYLFFLFRLSKRQDLDSQTTTESTSYRNNY